MPTANDDPIEYKIGRSVRLGIGIRKFNQNQAAGARMFASIGHVGLSGERVNGSKKFSNVELANLWHFFVGMWIAAKIRKRRKRWTSI